MNRVSDAERQEVWERCWESVKGSVPEYFTPGELGLLSKLRGEVFSKYLQGVKEVSEFGCGLGHNLLPLMGTGRRLRGFDWASSSVSFVKKIGIEAEQFDMLRPSGIKISGAVLTVHALEQLGSSWKPFLNYLLDQGPEICIHIEPIEELYGDSPRDRARLAYHRMRGYLSGFLTELRRLEKMGDVELIDVRKSPFGGKDHDAYSVIVWRPM